MCHSRSTECRGQWRNGWKHSSAKNMLNLSIRTDTAVSNRQVALVYRIGLRRVVNINDVMSFGSDVVCLRHSIVIFIILLSLVCGAELTKFVILASRSP